MKLEEIEEKYPGEWILVEVLERDENLKAKEVRLIEHSKDRDDTYEAIRNSKDIKDVKHFYNGEPRKDLIYAL